MSETQSSQSNSKKNPRRNGIKSYLQRDRMETIQGTEIEHRLIPLWLKLLILLVVMIILFIIGTMIGYGVLHNPLEVFKPETWQHIFDLAGRSS